MNTFLLATGTVALAEIGDKTQLLALLLAARYRRPWPIVAGILLATLLNHALAGWLGTLAARWLQPPLLDWIVALSFLLVANVPVVALGTRFAARLPLKAARTGAALLFLLLALWAGGRALNG